MIHRSRWCVSRCSVVDGRCFAGCLSVAALLSVQDIGKCIQFSLVHPRWGSTKYCKFVISMSVCLCVRLSAIMSPEEHVDLLQFLCVLCHGRGVVILLVFRFLASFLHMLIGCSTSPSGGGSELSRTQLWFGALE